MKSNILILALALLITFGQSLAAQEKYGDDPENCRVNLSTYTEFFNQKNFKDAYPAWHWCFVNCPEASKNIYIHGTTLIEWCIAQQTDSLAREAYIDTLLLVYDNRIKYFGQEGFVLGLKGGAMLKYRSSDVEAAHNVLEQSFRLLGDKTQSSVLGLYMNTTTALCGAGKLTNEKVVETYAAVIEVANKQIAAETKPKKLEALKKTVGKIEDLFVNSGAADCAAVLRLFEPKFEAAPDDVKLAKTIVDLIEETKSDSCKLSDLYMKTAVLVYNSEKTASSAHSIAQAYFKRKEYDMAETYYNEAAGLQTDSAKKADIYYEMGLLYYSTDSWGKCRQYAQKALAYDASYGKAYMLIGRAYAAGGGGCGESSLEKKYVNMVIVDQFIKAKNADPSIAAEANEYIGRFSARFPTREEGFWENVNSGQTVTVGCWINETTTVRFKD